MNELAERDAAPAKADELGLMVRELLSPVMNSIAQLLDNNTQAMDRIAATQQLMSERIAALEKQIRLQTPMSAKQAQLLNEKIRQRARELLDKRELADDTKAVTKLSGRIRKAVLMRYGTGSLREIPAHEYQVCMDAAGGWNDMLQLRDVIREAKARIQ